MTDPFVRIEKTGRIVTVTIDRADSRNAIAEHQDCLELAAALEQANVDPELSVLILTGDGSAFSAGGNLKAIRDRTGIGPLDNPVETRANYKRGIHRFLLALADLEIATIAAINGHAIGLGCDLACLCDLRIAADTAKFASSFVKLGLIPGDGGAWVLQRAIGYARAAEMILTGDTYSAAEVHAMGLVNKVVPRDQLIWRRPQPPSG
jgi:2-(1,2-epoxy-1,2-dihydrophenyl)acetyl-CoA isomerase